MLDYLNTHPDEFSNSFIPFLIASMQFFGGIFAELLNSLMLGTRNSVVDAIVFFVAFHVLTAIDNIYNESIADFSLREDEEDHVLKWSNKSSKIIFN